MEAILVTCISTLGVIITTIIQARNTQEKKNFESILAKKIDPIMDEINIFKEKINKLEKDSEEQENIKKALLSMISGQLIQKIEEHIHNGWCSKDAKYVIKEQLFEEYKRLGGNHGMEKLVEKVLSLPEEPSKNRRKEDKGVV